MAKGGSVGSQGITQKARGSSSRNSQPSYGGNQAGGLGSKGGSQSYQQPYRSPLDAQINSPEYQALLRRYYGQRPSYNQYGMRSGLGGQQQQQFGGLLLQGAPPNSYNNNFGPYVGNAGGVGSKDGRARQMGYAPVRQGIGGFF